MAATSTAWQDLLDSRFARIHNDRYKQLPDMIGRFFSIVGAGDTPTKDTYRTSSAGAFGDVGEFTGNVTYQDPSQGYDATITPKEYASGFQIERKLFDDGLYGVMDAKPRGLATAWSRTRQKFAAQLFNNAFSVDTTWLSGTDGVALCSNSHTTTSGASTSTGFDNLITTAFTATALAAARIQMVQVRGDVAERIAVMPRLIVYPPDLYDAVHEVVKSEGKPGVSTNDANVHQGAYDTVEWNYLTDSNNWFLIDDVMMKDAVHWFERIAAEFAMVEDFETLNGKWRLYARCGQGYDDWRWITGASVS